MSAGPEYMDYKGIGLTMSVREGFDPDAFKAELLAILNEDVAARQVDTARALRDFQEELKKIVEVYTPIFQQFVPVFQTLGQAFFSAITNLEDALKEIEEGKDVD